VLGGLRARPNEIKPDPVDQPERTAHYDCAMYIAEMLHRETVLLIFPFLQTNITVHTKVTCLQQYTVQYYNKNPHVLTTSPAALMLQTFKQIIIITEIFQNS